VADANFISSISVGSSSSARVLFTRFDTGHFCSKSFDAGFNNAIPASARGRHSRTDRRQAAARRHAGDSMESSSSLAQAHQIYGLTRTFTGVE
jgi:hypothetical protein